MHTKHSDSREFRSKFLYHVFTRSKMTIFDSYHRWLTDVHVSIRHPRFIHIRILSQSRRNLGERAKSLIPEKGKKPEPHESLMPTQVRSFTPK